MIRLAGTADWHADEQPWADYPEIRGDAEFSLKQILTHVEETEIDAVIAAGDLHQTSDPTPYAQRYVHRMLDRMAILKVPLYYVEGQHERHARSSVPRMGVHPWPTLLDKQLVRFKNFAMYGLSWRPTAELQEELQLVPKDTTMLVCHQVWEDTMAQLKATRRVEGRFADVPHARYILTGDFHQHLEIAYTTKDNREGLAWSPGAISLRAINETPEKAFWTFEVDEDRGIIVNVDEVILKTRPVHHLTLVTPEELDAACVAVLPQLAADARRDTLLPEELRRPIVRVTYQSELPAVYSRLVQTCKLLGVHFFPNPQVVEQEVIVLGDTLPETQENEDPPPADQALLDCLEQCAQPGTPEYTLTQRLLETPPSAETLDRLFAEFLKEEDVEAHE